jgi:hypothetical protein
MSNSLLVRLPEPLTISVDKLVNEASRTARILLCQEDSFKLDMFFTKTDSEAHLSAISISSSGYLFEVKNLDCGSYFFYKLDEYSELYLGRKFYQLCIMDIPEEKDTLWPLVCVSLAIAVANLSFQSVFIDEDGFWSLKEDEVNVEDFIKLANPHFLPLDEAMAYFYGKLPMHE